MRFVIDNDEIHLLNVVGAMTLHGNDMAGMWYIVPIAFKQSWLFNYG